MSSIEGGTRHHQARADMMEALVDAVRPNGGDLHKSEVQARLYEVYLSLQEQGMSDFTFVGIGARTMIDIWDVKSVTPGDFDVQS